MKAYFGSQAKYSYDFKLILFQWWHVFTFVKSFFAFLPSNYSDGTLPMGGGVSLEIFVLSSLVQFPDFKNEIMKNHSSHENRSIKIVDGLSWLLQLF